MRVGHVRERNGAAGAPWRLAASEAGGSTWLDLEVVRRHSLSPDPRAPHTAILYGQPITTLDEHLARSLRIDALAELVDGFAARDEDGDAVLDPSDAISRPPIPPPTPLHD